MNNNRCLDAKPREPMTRWNRRSDIQLTLNLFSRGVKYNPNATTDDLTFVFFTDGARKYKCGRAGTTLHDIRINEDGSVTCFLDRPNFNPGRLHVEVFVTAANADFMDNNFRICKPSCLPILIVEGHSDDVDPNVSVALSLPYIEVTIWDALVGHGYLSTSDEFWRKFVGLMSSNSITADGGIRVVLASMGEEYDGEETAHEQAPGECVYDGTRYQIAYMDNDGNVAYYSPSADLVYCNALTDKLYRWNGSGWTLINGGETVIQNRYVSDAAVVGNRLVLSSTGGGTASATVIANVNTLQAKIDELISKLSNSAFNVSPKPDPVGALDWSSGDNEGGDTPTTYYNISISTSMKYTMSNTATTIEAGQTYTNVIEANAGYDLTSVLVNGVAQTIANNKCTINIVNVSADITVTVTAEQQSVAPSTTYGVSVTATDLDVSPNGGTVVEGGTFQCSLALASGVDGNEYRLPRLDEITINGTHGTATLSNGVLTIPNIQSNIAIIASAIEISGETHAVTYNLTGCTKTSGPTEVEDGEGLTVVLAKDSSYEWGGGNDAAMDRFLPTDFVVLSGGIPLDINGQDNKLTITKSGNNITIYIPSVTADIDITNVIIAYNRYLNGNDVATQGSNTNSRYIKTHLPIPDGCQQIKVWHNYVNNGSGSTFNILTYDSTKVVVNNIPCTFTGDSPKHCSNTFNVTSSEKFIRSSLYNLALDNNLNRTIDGCYVYDVTHGKYIWRGADVQPNDAIND